MKYKKVLVALMLTCAFSFSVSKTQAAKAPLISDAPIQIHPAREDVAKPMNESASPTTPSKAKATVTKTISTKIQYNKFKKKKKKVVVKKIPPNYVGIEKFIENNDFTQADTLIQKAISQNSKDIKAQSLGVVSMARQYKLDPAQNELNTLLKAYPKNSDLHYAQGLIYYKRTTSSNMVYLTNTQKLLSDALAEFKKAIELDKNNAPAYNAAGVVSLNFGQRKEAKDYFKKAIEIDSKYATAIDNLGTISFSEGKFDEAEKFYKQALLYNSDSTTAMFHLAQLASTKQEYSKALTYLNNALAINPNSYAIYNLMGEIYEKQGNQAAAINAYKKSTMVRPEFTQSYLNLATVYEKRGDSEFAIEQLKTALSVNPDYYDAKLKIADISLASGKYKQAIENYSSLVGIDGYTNTALKGLANAYFEQSQVASSKALMSSNTEYFKAFDAINKATSANNDDLELHLAKLKLAKITNQPALAEAILKEIVQSPDGTNGSDLINTIIKGEAYLALNDYQNASKTFDLATKSTKSLEENIYLSEIFIYHKQYENAKVVLKNILDKDPQNQQAKSDIDYIQKCEKYADNDFKSAVYLLKTGNQSMALEYLSRSLSLNPNNAKAHLLLAEVYEKQKDYPNAIINYKAYLGLEKKPNNKPNIEKKIIRLEKK